MNVNLKFRLLCFISLFVNKLLYSGIAYWLQKLFDFLYLPTSLNTDKCTVFSIIKNWKECTDWLNGYEENWPWQFLLKYNRSEPVDYCQSADVSLYYLDRDYYYFVKTVTGVDLCDVDTFPFKDVPQHKYAIELIKVEHGVVKDYLQSTGRDHDGSNLTILYSTGRSGSTLTAAMIHKTGQAVVHSEPGMTRFLLNIHRDNKIPLTSTVTHGIAADMLRLMAPDVTKRYVIKAKPDATAVVGLLKSALPGIQDVFIYRNVRQNALSWKKIALESCTSVEIELEKNLHDAIWQSRNVALFRKHGYSRFDLDRIWVYRVLVMISNWTAVRGNGKDQVFQYEELVSDPSDFATRMLTACKIDICHVPAALTALHQDSQENSPISRGKLQKHTPISEKAMMMGKRIAEDMGLAMNDWMMMVQ